MTAAQKNQGLLLCLLIIMGVAYFYFNSDTNTDGATKNSFITNEALLVNNIDSFILAKIEIAYQLGKKERKYKQAIKIMDSLLNIKNFQQSNDNSKGLLYHRLGAFNFNLENHETAKEFIDQAIATRSSSSNIPKTDLAKSYFVRSLINRDLNLVKNQLADILEAIKILEVNNPDDSRLERYYFIASDVYSRLKDQKQADFYHQKVYDNTLSKNDSVSELSAERLLISGSHFIDNGEFSKGIDVYQKSSQMYSQLGLIHNVIEADLGIAHVYLKTGDYSKARKRYQSTLSEINNYQGERDLWDVKRRCLNDMAYNELADGKNQQSRRYYQQLLDHVQAKNQVYDVAIARAWEGLGDVDLEEKKYISAIEKYHKGIEALCDGYTEENSFSAPVIHGKEVINMEDLQRILGFKLQAMEAEYQRSNDLSVLEALNQNYITYDSVVFHIRRSYRTTASRYALVAQTLSKYERAIQTSLELYEKKNDQKYLQNAYRFAAKNKAIVLLDGLQEEDAKFEGIPPDLLEKEQKIKNDFYQIESQLFGLTKDGNQKAIKEAKDLRFKIHREYQRLIADFEDNYPKYHELKYAYTKLPDPAELARQLPRQAAILEYFVGYNNIYTFVITKDGRLSYSTQARGKTFGKQCRAFSAALESEELPDFESFSSISKGLYDLTLNKVLQELNSSGNSVNRLIIVPDGPLLQISFDALFYETPAADLDWSSSQLPYLGGQYAISYAYSNQLIFDNKKSKRAKRAVKTFTGFGLNYSDSLSLASLQELSNLKVDTIITRGMGELPYSPVEVQAIADITKGDAILNDDATKLRFIKESPRTHILHLAMHGFIVKENPMNSGLIFSKKGQPDDYILKAADLYTLKLNADLVVLSACHTGAGTIKKGEGVRTLARAFNYAGCSSVVASLWSAPDFSTKEIMVYYYKYLMEGLPKDIALQKAKIAFFQNAPASQTSPGYWSHLITIGDCKPIDF